MDRQPRCTLAALTLLALLPSVTTPPVFAQAAWKSDAWPPGPAAAGVDLAVSRDGALLMTAGEHRIEFWRVATRTSAAPPLQFLDSRVVMASLRPDGARVAATLDSDVTAVYDVATGKELARLTRSCRAIYSGDGKRLLTAPNNHARPVNINRPLDGAREDATVLLYDGDTHQLLHEFRAGTQALWTTFSPDGTRVLVLGNDGPKRDQTSAGSWCWDANSGRLLWTGRTSVYCWPWEAHPAAFSPDGATLATASPLGVRLLDARDGSELMTLEDDWAGDDVDSVRGVAFSADGARVAGTATKYTRVWNVRDGTRVGKRLPSVATYVAFSPTGSLFTYDALSGGALWNVDAGAPLLTVPHRVAPTQSEDAPIAAFAPDGSWLALTSNSFGNVFWSRSPAPER